MRVKPCNIRIPSSLSDAQVAADAACAAKRYAYSAEQVESRLNSYVDELTGLDLEQIAANTAAAAEVVERAEAAAETAQSSAATAQSSAATVETLAAYVKEIHDEIIEQDLEQLREDIDNVTDLIPTAQQAAKDASESASSAHQSETAATAALTDTWTAYSAILSEKDNAAAHFATEAEEKVSEAVTAQLNPGGDFYAAVNTAVHDTIPNTVKEEADEYVTQLTTEGGSLYNYVEGSKAEISLLQSSAVSTIITHKEAALTAITTAETAAIASIGDKVDADIASKINPEYISEKVNDVLPELIDKELEDENGAWNTAKNEAIADAKEQAELARQWATSDTHVAGTSYSGAYGYMLITERLADAAAQSESSSDDAANRAAESASAASVSAGAAANSANAASVSASNAEGYATRSESARDLAEQYAANARSLADAASASASEAANSASAASDSADAAANSESNAKASETAAATSETNAKASETAAYSSAEAAASSESKAAGSENLAERYMDVAEAFAVGEYEYGFIIRDTENGPVVEAVYSNYSDEHYSSAKTCAELAASSAEAAYSWAEGDSNRSARAYADKADSYANRAYSWAESDTVITTSYSNYSQNQAASARMWAEAEELFYLNGEEHKSAKLYAYSAKGFAESAEASEINVAANAEDAANSAAAASQSANKASTAATNASNKASEAATSEANAANSASAASDSAEAARLYSLYASSSASESASRAYNSAASAANSASSADLSTRYAEVAEAFAVSEYEYGFVIEYTDNVPVVEMAAPGQEGYSSARTYAYSARDFANNAYSYMQTAYSWAALETTFSYNSNDVASARTWAEAEEPFTLNEVEHESAKAWAEKAVAAYSNASAKADQANNSAADAATAYSNTVAAYEGTLNAYEGTLNAYSYTKAAVGEAETYLTDVNAVKSTIEQALNSSNWTANNIPVDASGAFTVAIGLVYAVWSKEACEIYKDAALENKLCTIWAEEQRCILATQATYYVSPVEQAASVIITSVQYTQPSA